MNPNAKGSPSRDALVAVVNTTTDPFTSADVAEAVLSQFGLKLNPCYISASLSTWSQWGLLKRLHRGGGGTRSDRSLYQRRRNLILTKKLITTPPVREPLPVVELSRQELAWREFRATITLPEAPSFE